MEGRIAGVAAKVAAIPRTSGPASWTTNVGHIHGEGILLGRDREAGRPRQCRWGPGCRSVGSVPLSKEKLLELDPDILMLPPGFTGTRQALRSSIDRSWESRHFGG